MSKENSAFYSLQKHIQVNATEVEPNKHAPSCPLSVDVDDSQVRRCLKSFGCLAFVPVPFVIVEFEKIQESAPGLINSTNFVLLEIILLHVPMYVLDFVDYFEDTFLGRVIRNNRRRAPRFSVNMWNCFSRLDEELPRTNNSSDG
ncbi:unnamed protein product [Rotaria magnacalcarata]